MRITGAIIAGGKSSRMEGREKAFLSLGGKSILDLVIGRFEPQVDRLIINSNGEAGRFAEFGLEVIPDVLGHISTPLAGIHAALCSAKEAQSDVLITVPSDTPFLPLDLVEQLSTAARKTGAAIAASGGQEQFLIGAWRTELLSELVTAIDRDGVRRVQDWASRVSAEPVEWPTQPYDPFFNLNTPEDLRMAEKLLRAS
jgi:molybdenum cofactor guanylyltransferase